jgi:hypothetical protein
LRLASRSNAPSGLARMKSRVRKMVTLVGTEDRSWNRKCHAGSAGASVATCARVRLWPDDAQPPHRRDE